MYAETKPELRTLVGRLVEKIRQTKFLQLAPAGDLPKITQHSWYIPVSIGDKNYYFLFDSGSAVTAISPKVYGSIPNHVKTRIAGCNISLCTASGSDLPL